VQGRLRGTALSVEIETSCTHCGKEIHIRLDSDGACSVKQKEAQILVFEPEVDWTTFTKPNIIDDF
jgi:hypothetical protein